ncbi:MAG: serine/threonine protein kinase [Myxococcales bacterium]|nr:serine/threonine protein kinase [Myxococcales bacterium]
MRPTEPAALSDGDTLAGPGGGVHHDLAPPARIGRYLVLHELGRGGMGVVLLAYDPELDRKVAVKLLGAQGADAAQQDRLLREAQAMARLAHPNVAAVFDVGVLGGQVYLAMEYVEGESLRAWLGARRPWRVVVDMFVQAGRGLAAAHAAGLVHRDFKPDNAIVGRDGRVRVLDFGLAALGTNLSEGPSAPPSLTSLALPGLASRSLLSSRLTADGALVGTLAYMSPEQLALAELDPRSDQFSFCVALHEALHAELPFAGETAGAYVLAVTSGAVRAPPRGAVPRYVDRALARGLAVAREDRFPDMDRLLAALTRDPAARLRRLGLLGLGVAASVGVGLLVGRSGDDAAACAAVDAPVAAAWGDETRARVRAAVTATGLPYAADALAAALPRIDAWVAAWSTARREVCRAHRDGALSDALHDREVTCLSGQVHDLAARTRLLAAADGDAVANAVAAVEALPDPGRCLDPALLGDAADPEAAARVREADAEQDLGHYQRARELAAAAVAAAAGDIDLAEALYVEGQVLYGLGQPREARAALVRAFTRAAAVGSREVGFTAASQLLVLAADEFRELDEARLWRDIGAELLAGGALEPRHAHATFPHAEASYAAARGDYDAAIEHLSRAVAWSSERDPDTLAAANLVLSRARMLRLAERYADAEADYLRVRRIYDGLFGPHHPQQATLANNLGVLYGSLHRYDEGLRELERARAIVRAIEGESSLHLAYIASNLIEPYTAAGRHDEAVAAARAALATFEREVGPATARAMTGHNNLGHALLSAHRCEEARPELERALAIAGEIAAVPTDLSTPLYNLAYCALELRQYAAAVDYTARALEALGAAPDSREHDHTRLLQSRGLVGLGRHREAVALLEGVLARWQREAPVPDRRGDARFVLAQALWLGALDRPRALAEARAARELQRSARYPHFPLADVEAWLAERE